MYTTEDASNDVGLVLAQQPQTQHRCESPAVLGGKCRLLNLEHEDSDLSILESVDGLPVSLVHSPCQKYVVSIEVVAHSQGRMSFVTHINKLAVAEVENQMTDLY